MGPYKGLRLAIASSTFIGFIFKTQVLILYYEIITILTA